MKIIQSMLLLEKEKLVVLSREIGFIYEICNFYSTNESNVKGVKIDLEENFSDLKEKAEDLYKKVKKLDEEIEASLKQTRKSDPENLIYIDYFRKDINKVIKQLKLINSKVFQMFRDGYNQYIPKPTPGRMFSNINMTSQIEHNLKTKLKQISSFKDKNVQLSVNIIWDFSNSYKIKKVVVEKKITKFFQMSYWYFDLPFLIPALTHELGHIVIEEDKNVKDYKKGLLSDLIKKINLNKKIQFIFYNYLYEKNSAPQNNLLDHWMDEILADVLSLLYHGDAYLLTFAHNFLGYYFTSTFNKSTNTSEDNEIQIAPWKFNPTRDSTFIRLAILIEIRKIVKNSHENQSYGKKLFDFEDAIVDEIEALLNSIYLVNEDYKGYKTIKKYYKDWHNYLNDFEAVEGFIVFIFKNIITYFQDNPNLLHSWVSVQLKNKKYKDKTNSWYSKFTSLFQTDEGEKQNNIEELPKYFKDLWVKRFNGNLDAKKVPHKYELRKKTHRTTIIKIYNNIYKDREKKEFLKIIKPYILTFYKYKIDHLSDIDCRKLEEVQEKNELTLGIYDQVVLETELENNEDYIKPEIELLPTDTIKRYALKFNLMKILNDIKGENTEGNLNIFIQIEIKKNLDEFNIYDNLFGSIKALYKYFNEDKQKVKFSSVQTFKSLGPKDIIIRIEKTDIDFIYEIKEFLSENNLFLRTFTTISYLSNKKKLFESNDKHVLHTDLRLSDNGGVNIAELLSEYNSKIEKCYMTTGVMDYHIEWKPKTSLIEINGFFKDMIEKKCAYDIQTNIVHEIPLISKIQYPPNFNTISKSYKTIKEARNGIEYPMKFIVKKILKCCKRQLKK